MRKLLFFILLGLAHTALRAQEQPTIEVRGEAKIDFVSDSVWLTRFADNEIAAFREQNSRQTGDVECDLLLLGSSSFRLWTTAAQDLAPLRVANRAFGGSTVYDQLYYYEDMLGRYKPANIALYIGNDLKPPAEKILIGELYKRFCALIERLHKDFPEAHIYFFSINVVDARIAVRAQIEAFNSLMNEFASVHPQWLTFVNAAAVLLDGNGAPDNSLFIADKLHLNEQGYALWSELFRGYLFK